MPLSVENLIKPPTKVGLLYYFNKSVLFLRLWTKKHSGKTTKQLLIDRRILEAKRLLAYTDTPLKQIAFQLGYDECAYFCRIFKHQTSLTPTAFKQKIQVIG